MFLADFADASFSITYQNKQFPGYNKPIASDRPGKKKMVLAKDGDKVKLLHFGDANYKHNYSKKAKKSYLARAGGIKDKNGNLTSQNKLSANYWSMHHLWSKNKPVVES